MTDFEKQGPEAVLAWARENLDRAVHELMDAGKLAGLTIEARPSWAMPGRYVIGQVRDNASAGGFKWVIAGEFQTDLIDAAVAGSARDAARHFSLKWQLDAEKSPGAAEAIVRRAEELYAISEMDEVWKELA